MTTGVAQIWHKELNSVSFLKGCFRPKAAGEAIVRQYEHALLSYWLIRAEAEVRDIGAPVLIQLGIEIVE